MLAGIHARKHGLRAGEAATQAIAWPPRKGPSEMHAEMRSGHDRSDDA